MHMFKELKSYLDENKVKLVAVSKTRPQKSILELYDQGQRLFGENRVQELVDKHSELPKDIAWHMIGSLQKNKVKYIAPFISLIHSVDSLGLAQTIEKEAIKNNKKINILLQVKIAKEDSKAGYDIDQLMTELPDILEFKNINILGLMGMGTFTKDTNLTTAEFKFLTKKFRDLKESTFSNSENFTEISMGMSGDYKIAVQCGTTMVRIGSLLFS